MLDLWRGRLITWEEYLRLYAKREHAVEEIEVGGRVRGAWYFQNSY